MSLKDLVKSVRDRLIGPAREDLGPHNRSLPEADKAALSRFIVEDLLPEIGIGPMPLDELLLLASTLSYFKPDLIVEWGTHVGYSARVFYEASRRLKLETEIHSVDLPLETQHAENLKDENERGQLVRGLDVELHVGDGLETACQLVAARSPKMPLFFVDGDHSRETVWRELSGLKQCAAHAVVLAHDTFYQGPESGYNCGPYQALTQFTTENELPMYSTVLGLPGMSLTYW